MAIPDSVIRPPAVHQRAGHIGEVVVVGQHDTAFTRIQIFRGLKTEPADVPDAADAFSFPLGAMGLRRIFHKGQIVPSGNIT